jgi:hypothetical protein
MIHALIATPAFFKVVVCFAAILLFNRAGLSLGGSIVVNSALLVLWSGLGLRGIALEAHSFALPDNYLLLVVIVLLLFLTEALSKTGRMETTVQALRQWLTNHKLLIAGLPALVGLLPMPGGALFSAPMVDSVDEEKSLDPAHKVAINYWFRHIWEYWWPLYPTVVLVVALLKVEMWQFIAFMLPMTIVMVLAGVVFILRPIKREPVRQKKVFSSSGLKTFLWEIMPILIVVMVIIFLACLTGLLNLFGININLPGAVSILPGLLVSTIWVCLVNRISFKQLTAAVYDRSIFSIVFLVAAIMIFQGIMKDSRAVVDIRNELMAYRIPILLVIVIMPFLSGLITGIGIGFVGTSFPLIIPLFPVFSLFVFLSHASLAFVFGFMGMMLSPVHLCFLVTKDYFKANLLGSYRLILKPVLSMMAVAVVFFFISRAL